MSQNPRIYDRYQNIREEYRRKMNDATSAAQMAAGSDDMTACSLYSTQAERYREAFAA